MADTVPTISAAGSSAQKTTGTRLRKAAKPKGKAHGVPTSGERLAAWLANPGLRSKLSDSALTPELLKTRQTNTFNAAPAAPGSSYTNKQLNDLVSVLTQQKYGGAESALNQQAKAVPVWFQTYRDQVAGALQRQQPAAAQQVTSLQQMATQAAGDTGGLAGAPMDAAGAARAQAAAQIRSAGVGNQAALAQNLGGIQSDYLGNLGLLSNGQQQAAQQHVGDQLTQLLQDKGAFKTTQRQQILSDETDSALKNALTTAQIGSTDANAAATKASTTKTKVETSKSRSDQAFFDKHGYYPSTGKPKAEQPYSSGAFAGYTPSQVRKMPDSEKAKLKADGKKHKSGAGGADWGTPEQQGKAQDGVSTARSSLSALLKADPSLKHDRHKAAQYLLQGSKGRPVYETVKDPQTGKAKQQRVLEPDGTQKTTGSLDKSDPLFASVALDMHYDGHISKYNVGRLHARGIQIKSLGLPTKGPLKKKSGAEKYPTKNGPGAGQ